MRMLHTADWHLGRQFHQASLIEDQRHVLRQIVNIVQTQKIDVLLIAGDIYDRAIPPVDAVELLDETLAEITATTDVLVYLISGNHDSAERLGFGADLLTAANIHIQTSLEQSLKALEINVGGTKYEFFGIPYFEPSQVAQWSGETIKDSHTAHKWITDQILELRDTDALTILASHCFITGGTESDSERVLTVGGAEHILAGPLEPFDYVALGHLHSPQSCGYDHVRYSGSPLKYSFSEHEQGKSVTIVEFDDTGCRSIDSQMLSPLREVRILKGLFDDLVAGADDDEKADDYLEIHLEDDRAILNAMSQLRAQYPNVLHLRKPGLAHRQSTGLAAKESLLKGESQLFGDFFQQITGDRPSTEQQAILDKAIVWARTELDGDQSEQAIPTATKADASDPTISKSDISILGGDVE